MINDCIIIHGGEMKVQGRSKIELAKDIFLQHAGMLRTKEAIREGIHPRTLYAMRETGVVETLCRGLYRLADLPPLGNPDLVSIALKVPRGVICLISALSYHEITTQIPHQINIALARGAERPRLDYPPIRIYRFSGKAYTEGIDTPEVDGIPVRVYGPEKTLADCFKYRHKIGIDVAVEALKLYREKSGIKVDELMKFAGVCRVEKVMRPYLEMSL